MLLKITQNTKPTILNKTHHHILQFFPPSYNVMDKEQLLWSTIMIASSLLATGSIRQVLCALQRFLRRRNFSLCALLLARGRSNKSLNKSSVQRESPISLFCALKSFLPIWPFFYLLVRSETAVTFHQGSVEFTGDPT